MLDLLAEPKHLEEQLAIAGILLKVILVKLVHLDKELTITENHVEKEQDQVVATMAVHQDNILQDQVVLVI